jgi:hypothetical protein
VKCLEVLVQERSWGTGELQQRCSEKPGPPAHGTWRACLAENSDEESEILAASMSATAHAAGL